MSCPQRKVQIRGWRVKRWATTPRMSLRPKLSHSQMHQEARSFWESAKIRLRSALWGRSPQCRAAKKPPSVCTKLSAIGLSGLLGSGAMGTLAQSVAKFAGVGESSGKSILGVLGPVILGVLGQQQRLGGLDANGLASLLGSQKDQIAASIPSGLTDMLTSAGLFDRAEGKLRSGIADASILPAGLPARRNEQFPGPPRQLTRQRTRRRRTGPIGSSRWLSWAASAGMYSVAQPAISSLQRLPQRHRRRPPPSVGLRPN